MKTNFFLMIMSILVTTFCLWGVYLAFSSGWYFIGILNIGLAGINAFLGYVNFLNYRYYRTHTNWWDTVQKEKSEIWHKLENQ